MLQKLVKNNFLKSILEWAIAIAIALLAFLIIDNFVVKSSRIDGSSMEPTYSHHDRVLVNRLVYLFSEPQLGDVIAFPYAANPEYHYIKRIVALPGDVMDMRDGFFYRNDVRLNDQFSQDPINSPFMHGDVFPVMVEDDTFFVLGDNRQISEDSRFSLVGNIPRADIIGRVSFRWLPLNRFGFVE